MPYCCQVSWLRFCDLPFGPAIHLHNSWTGLPVVSLRFVFWGESDHAGQQ